jgi:hypothetical protein
MRKASRTIIGDALAGAAIIAIAILTIAKVKQAGPAASLLSKAEPEDLSRSRQPSVCLVGSACT